MHATQPISISAVILYFLLCVSAGHGNGVTGAKPNLNRPLYMITFSAQQCRWNRHKDNPHGCNYALYIHIAISIPTTLIHPSNKFLSTVITEQTKTVSPCSRQPKEEGPSECLHAMLNMAWRGECPLLVIK